MNQSLTGNDPLEPSYKFQNYVPNFVPSVIGLNRESINGVSADVRGLLDLLEVGENEAEGSIATLQFG